MRDTDLFQLALGLVPPWMVKACAFDAERKRLDIEIDFARGGRFPFQQAFPQLWRSSEAKALFRFNVVGPAAPSLRRGNVGA